MRTSATPNWLPQESIWNRVWWIVIVLHDRFLVLQQSITGALFLLLYRQKKHHLHSPTVNRKNYWKWPAQTFLSQL